MAGRPPPYYYPYGAPPPSHPSFQTSSGQLPPPPPPPPLHSSYAANTNATATPAATHATYQTSPYLPGGYSALTPPFSYNHALHPTSSVYAQTPSAPAPAPIAPPPEPPQEWYCDACELSLTSEQAFKSHRKTHVKCTECSFEGAPKVVKGHFQAVHGKFSGSGFKTVTISIPGCRVQRFQICVGNRPEDIQRWIADRKRKFPRQQQAATNISIDPAASTSTETENKGGVSSLLAGYGSSDDSEEESPKETTGPAVNAEAPANPTSSETPTADVAVSNAPTNNKQRLCRFFLRNGTCRNGNNCHFLHEKPSKHTSTIPQNDRKRKRGRPTTSDTLLRKLLATDMDREATLTMQLLKHIVDKEFYR